jgi:PAS domain S-box-containing protein
MAKRGDKTREQLIKELAEVRSQIIELKASETKHNKIEKVLKESERKYSLLFENSGSAITFFDTKGICVFLNTQAATNLGGKVEDFIGNSTIHDMFPEKADFYMQRFFKIVNEGKGDIFEDLVELSQGKRWFSSNIQPVKDESENVVGVQIISYDITEHKEMEQEMEIKDNAIASSINAIAIADLDRNLTYVNNSCVKMWGYDDSKDILGKVGTTFWELGDKGIEVSRALLSRGSWMGELTARRKDGSTFDAHVSASIVTDEAGKPICILGSFLDITEQKRMEERIVHLNQLLRANYNVSHLITREKDPDSLLKGVCDTLVESRGYRRAWLARLDASGSVVTAAEAGLGKDFLPVVNQLKRDGLTACGKKALEQSEIVVTIDPLSSCPDCPLASKYDGMSALTARLEHDDRVYGVLSCSVPECYATDEEERSLFQRVVRDIGFALYNIETENRGRRALDALTELSQMLK